MASASSRAVGGERVAGRSPLGGFGTDSPPCPPLAQRSPVARVAHTSRFSRVAHATAHTHAGRNPRAGLSGSAKSSDKPELASKLRRKPGLRYCFEPGV
jgi:hypothetical protein